MPAIKPTKESIAFYALDSHNRFLCVKRSDDDDSLPGVWGLPAASLRNGETSEDAVRRAARDKLGFTAVIKRFTGDDTQDRGEYILHLKEYEIDFPETEINLQANDPTVSNYADFQWADDPEILREAADRGSSCSRIFLRNLGLWADGD